MAVSGCFGTTDFAHAGSGMSPGSVHGGTALSALAIVASAMIESAPSEIENVLIPIFTRALAASAA